LRHRSASHYEAALAHAPASRRRGEELCALHQVGSWVPVTPVDLAPTLAGGDTAFRITQKRDGIERETGVFEFPFN
jgi:hypothetical protein